MNYNITKYRRKYYKQCVGLMGDTWDFNKHFPDRKKPNLINNLYFRLSIIDFNYSQVILDDKDRVCGFIYGKVKNSFKSRIITILKVISALFICLYHYLAGNMGVLKDVNKVIKTFFDVENQLNSKVEENDAYVSLFFVGSSLRGTGLGKKLMNDFTETAKSNKCNRIYLYTDKGCNYGFYDHLGFKRIIEISSTLLDGYGDEPNGFAYVKPLLNS